MKPAAPRPSSELEKVEPYQYAHSVQLSHPSKKSFLKLNCNEATYDPSPKVKEALRQFIQNEPLHWYPDTSCRDLRASLSGYVGFDPEYISVFNGCDHALETICRTYLQRGDEVAIFAPTYDNFRVFAESAGGVIRPIFARSAFETNIEGLSRALNSRTRLVYLSNPTNPTGLTYSLDQIEQVLRMALSALVIIDEAYFEFWGQTSLSLIRRYPNLLITRSFSKAFALAGLRCGYVISDPANIKTLETVRNGKNVNSLAQVAAAAALSDLAYYQEKIQQVHATAKWFTEEMNLLGVLTRSTPANYVLIKVSDPEQVEAELIARNVFVRNRSGMPQLDGFLRITVGLMPEMKKLLQIFGEIAPVLLSGPALRASCASH